MVVESLLLVTPPELPPRKPADFIEYLKLLGRFRKLGPREITGLVKIFTQSAADLLDEWFESPEIKVTLATDGVIGANGGPRSAGTAYILMHHCMGGVAGKRGLWGFVQGGMGAVSEAIAASARSKGAEIRMNAPVEPRADARRARLWRRAGEWRRDCTRTSSLRTSIPKRRFCRLIEPRHLDPEFRNSIEHFRVEGTSLKMNLALDGLPDFTALSGRARSAARRDHAHLPVHRLRGARVG